MGTEFQLLNRPMWCGAKDPEKNVALDRREARQAGAGKRQRRVEVVKELRQVARSQRQVAAQACSRDGPEGPPFQMRQGSQWIGEARRQSGR